MTKPMSDADLADLRNTLERATIALSEINARHITEDDTVVPLASIDIDDVRALVARLDAAEQEIQLARRERSILLDVVDSLTEDQLSAIPEGKLVLALRTMDEADKAKDYHTFVDSLIAELASYKAGGRNQFMSIVRKLDAAEELIREVAAAARIPSSTTSA